MQTVQQQVALANMQELLTKVTNHPQLFIMVTDLKPGVLAMLCYFIVNN